MRAVLRRGVTLPAVLCLLLSGCGALDPGDDDPHTLVVHTRLSGTAPGAATFNAAVQRFEKENPSVHVKVIANGDDLPQVYETSRLAGKEADIVMAALFDKALRWTELGATVPVNRYLDRWGLRDRFPKKALQQWTDAQGRVRGFPFIATNWPVAYNTKLLRAAGVRKLPTSTAELIRVAHKLRAHGTPPVVVGGNDWSGEKLLLQVIQSHLTGKQARKLFRHGGYCSSPAAMKGIRDFTRLREAGVFVDNAQGLTADSMTTRYNTGKAAIMSAMSSALAQVPDNVAKNTKIGGWPVPRGAKHSRPTSMLSYDSTGVWISPNGQHKLPLVKKFITFLYKRSTVDRFITDSGRDMAVRSDADPSTFPLVEQGKELTGRQVSNVVLPDQYVPASASQPLIRATSIAFTKGTGAHRLCRSLDTAYHS